MKITLEQRDNAVKWFIKALNNINHNGVNHTGWYKSGRKGPTGIGFTLESAFGKPEDNLQQPDLKKCIELKAHDTDGESAITLFTKAPSQPRGANTLLRKNYGYKENGADENVLHTSVYKHGDYNSKSGHLFKIIDDKDNQKVTLIVSNKDKSNPTRAASWSYDRLNKAMSDKIKVLAIVKSERKINNGIVYYKYPHADIIKRFDLEELLNAINNDDAFVDLRIGAYQSGKNKGKTHDHGTGFRMKLNDVIRYAKPTKIIKI